MFDHCSFLAHGDSYRSLATRFRSAPSTVAGIVTETCNAIWDVLVDTEMPAPTESDWKRIENQFATRWNFPNCVGALDGKHIVITAPHNSGSLYYNYKGTFSINLMALVDGNYKFIAVDVGQYGSNADSGVFQKSTLGQMFLKRKLGIPGPKALPGAPEVGVLPHCIVADEAFPLRVDLMRPYPRRRKGENLPQDKAIFNYRLSRARRIVENAFGILAQRWRIFNRRIQLKEDNVIAVVKACCVLHNYLRDTPDYQDRATLDVNTEGDVLMPAGAAVYNLAYMRGYHSAKDALKTRELFKTYFNSEKGSVPWQLDRILHH